MLAALLAELDDDSHNLTHLEQQVRLGTGKDRESAQAIFNAHENVTRIDVQPARGHETHVRKPGLLLLQTNTAHGALSVTY